MTPGDLLCKGAQQLLPQKKAMLCKLPQTPSRFYWVFTPQVFAIHLSPLHSLACCTPTGTQDPLGQASTAVGVHKASLEPPRAGLYCLCTSEATSLSTPLHTPGLMTPASTAILMHMGRPCRHRRACMQPRSLQLLLGPDAALSPITSPHCWACLQLVHWLCLCTGQSDSHHQFPLRWLGRCQGPAAPVPSPPGSSQCAQTRIRKEVVQLSLSSHC